MIKDIEFYIKLKFAQAECICQTERANLLRDQNRDDRFRYILNIQDVWIGLIRGYTGDETPQSLGIDTLFDEKQEFFQKIKEETGANLLPSDSLKQMIYKIRYRL